uniref:GAG-pre-integrase domain-containing protein n=1 Tax=Cannabis sativa TaxID=3483 RepID=A0A803PQY1_CANSA
MTGSLCDYLLKIKGSVDRLATIGHRQTTQDHMEAIFNGLPADYDVFVTSVTTKKDLDTVAKIEALLMAQSLRIEKDAKNLDISKSEANLSQGRNNGFGAYGRPNYFAPIVPPGFNSYNSDFNKSFNSPINSNHGGQYQYAIARGGHSSNLGGPPPNNMPSRGPPYNRGLGIEHIGNSSILSPFSLQQLNLHNLLHVPAITKNLLSVSQFAQDNKVLFESHPSYCCVKDIITKKILLAGNLDQGLYKFQPISLNSVPTPSLQISPTQLFNSQCHNHTTSVNSSSFSLWHSRLGHPAARVVTLALSKCYSMSHKGYKCLSKDKRLYISRNVVFDQFPYPHTAATQTSSNSQPPTVTTGLPPVPPLLQQFTPMPNSMSYIPSTNTNSSQPQFVSHIPTTITTHTNVPTTVTPVQTNPI